MNGQSNNAKQFRCNSFFIRLGDKAVFLALALGIISLLSACVSIPNPNEPPVRLSDLSYQDTNQNAYLWISGYRSEGMTDYATVIRIDDVNVPDEYLPGAGEPPYYSWLLEIPAGKHVIEILYKENDLISGVLLGAISYGLGGALTFEKSRQTLTFIAEPNQTYHPFVADGCSQEEYFWIEYWGPYVAGTETAQRVFTGIFQKTDMRKPKPVVAGERPNQKPCE